MSFIVKYWFDLNTPGLAEPQFHPSEIAEAFAVSHARHLGSGGFGETWLLEQDGGKQVAKILNDPDYRMDRLRREVEGLRRVEACPHVVRLQDVVLVSLSAGDRIALRFEYIEGADVMARLRAGQWPTETEIMSFATGLLRGLVALHGQQTIHRDIKPENLALRPSGWDQPVILDLGLSKFLDQPSITTYPAILGTAPYMAPEQIQGRRARTTTDLWAVGVVLYLLFTRRHPFYDSRRIDQVDALERLQGGPPPLAGVGQPLASLVHRLLSYKPYERGSARRALAELQTQVEA